MRNPVALVTPSHRADIKQFALLCESIEWHLRGYERHYVIVTDDDLPYFAEFGGGRRVVIPTSQLLPCWLKLAPSFLARNGRRIWWSLRSRPVHGWHVQQILKIAAASQLREQRFCLVDSDFVFIRPFDVGAYAGGASTPLYLAHAAIAADKPRHADWTRNCDRLLGLEQPTTFPADDYIGQMIVWDKDAVHDMTRATERVTGTGWVRALCNTRAFSEFLLYGRFVRSSPQHLATHRITTERLVDVYWDFTPLDSAAVIAMVNAASARTIALCVQSYSRTPVSFIRDAVGLRQHQAGEPSGPRPLPGKQRPDAADAALSIHADTL
jgi:hypothetical protein